MRAREHRWGAEIQTSTSYISWHNQSELWDNVCLLTKGKRLINGAIWPKKTNKEWFKFKSLNIWSFFFFNWTFIGLKSCEMQPYLLMPACTYTRVWRRPVCLCALTFMFHCVCRTVRFTLDWLLVNHALQTEQQISGLRCWQPTQHERDKQDVNTFIHSPVQDMIHTLRRSGLDTSDLKPHSEALTLNTHIWVESAHTGWELFGSLSCLVCKPAKKKSEFSAAKCFFKNTLKKYLGLNWDSGFFAETPSGGTKTVPVCVMGKMWTGGSES